MFRRAYLALAIGTATLGVVGCLGDDGADQTDQPPSCPPADLDEAEAFLPEREGYTTDAVDSREDGYDFRTGDTSRTADSVTAHYLGPNGAAYRVQILIWQGDADPPLNGAPGPVSVIRDGGSYSMTTGMRGQLDRVTITVHGGDEATTDGIETLYEATGCVDEAEVLGRTWK